MDNIEHQIEQLHVSTSAETDKHILDDAFVALQTGLQIQQHGIRQWLATSTMAKPLAAAAVVLIAVSIFIITPDKDFDSVADFYRNLGRVENICVSTFEPGQTSPTQQVWTSQALKVRLFKTGIGDQARFALLDLANKVQTTAYLSNVKTEPLTEEKLHDLRQSMTPSFAMAPFFSAEDVPANAQWNRLTDPAVVANIPGCTVYELVWEQKSGPSRTQDRTQRTEGGGRPADSSSADHPSSVFRKWRVFVDAETHLPKRTESYIKTGSESEYRLEKFVVVTYPGKSDIREIVANNIGRPGGSTDDAEYISTPGIDR